MTTPPEAAERGLARLDDLRADLRAKGADLAALVAEAYDALDDLAAAFRLRRADYSRALLLCRVRGAGTHIDELDERVAERAADIGRESRPEPDLDEEEERPSLRAVFHAPADYPDYPQPDGFRCSPGGIVRLVLTDDVVTEHPICSEPVMVTRRIVDVNSGVESLVLGFRRDGWRTVTVQRSQVRDARAIVGLSNLGLPVSSNNARALVDFLVACEEVARLKAHKTTTRIGWHGDIYVAGPGCGDIELVDPNRRRAGWRPRGTYEGWLEGLEVIGEVPVAYTLLYFGAVGVLLRFLDLGFCPILDLSGPSGKGKTTAERAPASAYGEPAIEVDTPEGRGGGAIALTWDATHVAIEETAAAVCDAVLIIDDTKRSSANGSDHDNKKVANALYQLHQGRGRERGAKGGGLRDTVGWRNVVISTGERPAISNTESGGARNRVLSITATPVFPDRETARKFETIVQQHHGHLAPRVAEAALQLGAETLKAWLEEARAGWAERAAADTRLLLTVASISVAARVLHEVLEIPRPAVDPFEEGGVIERALAESAEEADQSGRAFAVVREDYLRHPDAYYDSGVNRAGPSVPTSAGGSRSGPPVPPPQGWHGLVKPDLVALLPGVLFDLLKDQGHDPEPVLQMWAKDGTLLCGDGAHLRRKIRWEDKTPRLYAFPRVLFDGEAAP